MLDRTSLQFSYSQLFHEILRKETNSFMQYRAKSICEVQDRCTLGLSMKRSQKKLRKKKRFLKRMHRKGRYKE